MFHKVFDNNLVTTRKSKLALKLNKLSYIGMSILDLGKVLMYEFHYHYIKINMTTNENYYSKTLIA